MDEKITLKSRVIPSLWKEDIDDVIERELVGANRYFAENNPRLSELVERISSLPPQEFQRELQIRWNWHNLFYEELLEPALPILLEPRVFALTPSQIGLIREVYRVGSLIDQATLVVSAAIKRHVDQWMENLPECKSLNNEEVYLLMTLPKEPYSVRYLIDHLSYFIAVKEGGQHEQIKRSLVEKYHAGDEQILMGRLRKFARLAQENPDELRKTKKDLGYETDRWVKHFYLTLERPRLKAIQQILDYDNNEEKRIAREMIGISGFILRKEVYRYLMETKILPQESGIYGYQDEVVDTALSRLQTYRQEVLDRQVVPYRQRGLTCSAACLTMVATHFGLVDHDESFEQEVVEASKSHFTIGQHFSGVATKAASLGLEVLLVHSSPRMFDNDTEWLPQDLFGLLMEEYRNYLKQANTYPLMRVENGRRLYVTDLKKYLEEGYLVIVAGVLGDDMLHAILLSGYNSQGYVSLNPLYGRRKIISESSLNTFMETKIGRWILALRPAQTPLEKLREALPHFETQAREYLA